MRTIAIASALLALLLVAAGPASAQSLQLSTANVNPAPWQNSVVLGSAAYFLPLGPVSFPNYVGLPLTGMALTRVGNGLTVSATGRANFSSTGGFQTAADLVTRLSMPGPARITLQIQDVFSYTQFATNSVPGVTAGVDLYADGTDEFFLSTFSQQTANSTLIMYCDSVGTLVRWHQTLGSGSTSGGGLQGDNRLTVSFDDPTPESTYGPTCAGELGCQIGSGTYDRIFVGSFPSNTTFAWLMGGTQQRYVQFAGFACPLLVEPQFILAVPLFNNPNNRRMFDFEGTFPAIPGLSFFAQAIAVSGGTFIGTNGVHIQT